MWNGFVKGLYREKLNDVVSQECFGEWITQNVTHIGQVADRILDSNFSVPYWEAQDLAVEAVNLLYVNIDRCEF